MYDSSGTIGPGINVGRAPKSTGAAAAAVTSASATAMKWSENCMGELISKVAEKQGQVVPSGVSDGGAPFIDGQKHSMEKKIFHDDKHGFIETNAIGLYTAEYYSAPRRKSKIGRDGA